MPRKTKGKGRKTAGPLQLLIDTCVWLDLAKDYRQLTLLAALEELVRQGEVVLIVPDIVRDEFARNKARIAEESGRSLSGVLKRVRDAVDQFGTVEAKSATLAQLNDIDHRIVTLGESVNASLRRIEALLSAAQPVPATDAIKLRAAQRAIEKRAPFHRQRNGMDDAVIIETFADCASAKGKGDDKFAFVTHNVKDFSDPAGDNRTPHPDLAPIFTASRAYAVSLAEVLNELAPELLEDFKFELEWAEEPRRLSEIVDAIGELTDKVWYNRHWNRRIKIEEGRIKVVEKESGPQRGEERTIQRDIWEGALKSAKRVEDLYGLENLGPWDDFEWGMINGKLSALRWVLGDEWDMLDT